MSCEEYDISSFGFLPQECADQLPSTWDHIQPLVDNLSTHDGQAFRNTVSTLPKYSPEQYSTHGLTLSEKKLLYTIVVLSVQKYVWGCGPANLIQEVPEELGNIMFEVAGEIDAPVKLTYAAIVLWSWAKKDKTRPMILENLEIKHKMLETVAYEWFCLIHVAIEAEGGSLVQKMIGAKQHMKTNNNIALTELLVDIAEALTVMSNLIQRMYEKCSPEEFWQFRFLFEGTNDPKLFPEGLKFRGGKHKPLISKGASGTQSSLIQSIDVLFNVKHEGHGLEVFREMRDSMPYKHKKFVEDMSQGQDIQDYINSSCDQVLLDAYNKAVNRLTVFRGSHFRLVHDYIFAMVNKQKMATKHQPQQELYKEDKTGTSGTEAKEFLEGAVKKTRMAKKSFIQRLGVKEDNCSEATAKDESSDFSKQVEEDLATSTGNTNKGYQERYTLLKVHHSEKTFGLILIVLLLVLRLFGQGLSNLL